MDNSDGKKGGSVSQDQLATVAEEVELIVQQAKNWWFNPNLRTSLSLCPWARHITLKFFANGADTVWHNSSPHVCDLLNEKQS